MTQSQLFWWHTGIVYQVYPRSFNDTNGDGIGDLPGVIEKLDYLQQLGIDAIWLSPFFPSPMKDFGYDVADYCDVHPMFGDLATFDKLIAEAHQRHIKIIIDWVPNHTSTEHPWFIESRSSRDNPKRDWYIWRDAKPDGSLPNNWGSIFGGQAWTFDETSGQYYFHQFDPAQPDLNWRNPNVKAAMLDTLRFWLRRGVDGFRMDVVYMIWKHPDMPDQPLAPDAIPRNENDIFSTQQQLYAYDYEGVHEIMREIRATLAEFGEDKIAIGEVWLPLEKRLQYLGNNDELHMPFNFDLIGDWDWRYVKPFNAAKIRQLVDAYDAALPDFATPNYVIGSHDIPRIASRLGSEARARVAAMLLLTLRGIPTIYNGEEIGMVNGVIPPDKVQDPQGIRLGAIHTRDQCRTPMQWDNSTYAGFSTVEPWLPVNQDFPQRNVATQQMQPDSMWALYHQLIQIRRNHAALTLGTYQSLASPEDTFVYMREYNQEKFLVLLNFSDEARTITLPHGGTILISTSLNRTGEVDDEIMLHGNEGILIKLG